MNESQSDVRTTLEPPHWVEGLLCWIERKRLQAPAALIFEMHRPLLPVAWWAAMLFGGVLAPLLGPDYYEKIEGLRDTAALDRVLARLESSSREDDG